MTYKGGISPYCLLVMLKAYLLHVNPARKSASVILEGFLKFFCEDFNQKTKGVDINGKDSVFYLREQSEPRIEVKDPLNGRIMTKNAYQYGKVKEELANIKDNSMGRLRKAITQHISSLKCEQLEQVLAMTPDKYFETHVMMYSRNIFSDSE